MKKILSMTAVALALIFGGCATPTQGLMSSLGQNHAHKQTSANTTQQRSATYGANRPLPKPNLALYINNPILNIEIDLILTEELGTMLKMNNLVLSRMPISMSDKWPELLKDYQKSLKSKKAKKAKEAYDTYLNTLLKKDYSFYRFYDPIALKKQMKSVGGLMLFTSPSALKKMILLKIVDSYGKNMEHLKNTISYKPLGCGAKYYNPKFANMFKPVRKSVCRRIERKLGKRCSFFSKPIEDILYKYEKGFYELKVGSNCFRAVEGRSYPSFKAAFYELLPDNKRDAIKEADAKLESINLQIATLKGELKVAEEAKKKDEKKISILKKKEESLSKRKDNIQEQRSKLFKEAKDRIVVDKRKAEIAMKLKTISDYIHSNLTSVGIGTTVLAINTLLDVKDIARLGAGSGNAIAMTAAIYMSNKKVKNQKEAFELAKKRLKLLLTRTVKLPQNAATIVYGIAAQESMLSDYQDYIDAVIEAGKKAKYIKE